MKDSLAPFQRVTAIPCPVGMDIEFLKNANKSLLIELQNRI